MSPSDLSPPGDYKLNYWVQNPGEVIPRADDWRHKPSWEAGTKFHCYAVYNDGRNYPSLYQGNRPENRVNEFQFDNIFNALLSHLERV